MQGNAKLVEGGSSFDDDVIAPPTDSNSSSPPHQDIDLSGTPGNRPVRAVVANAVAISEAQHEEGTPKKRGRKRIVLNSADMKKKTGSSASSGSSSMIGVHSGDGKKVTTIKKNTKSVATKISGLDLIL